MFLFIKERKLEILRVAIHIMMLLDYMMDLAKLIEYKSSRMPFCKCNRILKINYNDLLMNFVVQISYLMVPSPKYSVDHQMMLQISKIFIYLSFSGHISEVIWGLTKPLGDSLNEQVSLLSFSIWTSFIKPIITFPLNLVNENQWSYI